MTRDKEWFLRKFPSAYHVTYRLNLQGIHHYGLMPANELKRTAGVVNQGLGFRATEMRIEHPQVGPILFRDQYPMRPEMLKLRKCLSGLEPKDWYRLVDDHIFFCLTPNAIDNLKNKYKDQVVLRFDTHRLLELHEAAAHITPINSGAVEPAYAPRGPQTFHPFTEWSRSGFMDKVRKRQPNPVELAFRLSCLKAEFQLCD